MVTTRRSVYGPPTIPVARALRRERCARIAEAAILPPPSQIVASRSSSGQQLKSKSGVASQESRNKNKMEEEPQTLTTNPDFVPQIHLSQVEHDSDPQINLSQAEYEDPPPSTQPFVEPPAPDASQSPPAASQHQEAPEPWLIRDPTASPHLNLSQDSLDYPTTQFTIQPPSPDGSQSPPGPSQPHENSQFNLSQDHSYSSSRATFQPTGPEGSQDPPTSAPDAFQNHHASSQPREDEKFWFGLSSNTQGPLPNPTAPIFQPVESLVHFASGVPVVEETKPFDHGGQDDWNNGFFLDTDDREAIEAHSARRREAIVKAATAVMAHMDGHDVARSDYLSILDLQLADPDMRVRLPPVLCERYELAVKEKPSTLYNGGLIDKFINATKRATSVTARIFLNSKNAKRERKARRMRGRSDQAQHSGDLNSTQQYCSQIVSGPTHPAPTIAAAQRAQQPPVPRLFSPEPLTQANLNRAPDPLIKGKAKEPPALRDEERGVMRTSKGLVRSSPYPRRASSDVFRVACALANSSGNTQNKESQQESCYSVYSASSGLAHQQAQAKKVAVSMLDGVKNMFDVDTYDGQCVRAAEALLEETRRTKGAQAAANIRRGFDLLHCYELVKHLNVELLSDALLEHISETQKQPKGQPDAQLTPQLRQHPQLGWGYHSYAPVFQPIGSSRPYTEAIRPPPP